MDYDVMTAGQAMLAKQNGTKIHFALLLEYGAL
jgi:hypothetical protein